MVKFWIASTQYIDLETGEIITEKEFTENYIKVASTKQYKVGKNANYGNIKWTTTGRRKPNQLSIWDTEN